MTVVVRNDAQNVLLRDTAIPFAVEEHIDSRVIVEERMQKEFAFGSYCVQEYSFDGFHIASFEAEVYENISISVDEINPRVIMLFMENGNVATNANNYHSCHFNSHEHNLLYSPVTTETALVKKQSGIRFYGLTFTNERFLDLANNNGRTLDKLANNVAGNKAAILSDKINPLITPRMETVLADIRRCQFQGGLKKLFLQSKAIELLALQCEQFESGLVKDSPIYYKINTSDIEKLHHARELLLQNLQQPPSLVQLSRMTGLNEFKLKSGFKSLFDTTVFTYFNDHRLNLAKELILDSSKPLAEIADETGYSSPQHFSNAFRKKFGVNPASLRGFSKQP
ncbi:MAG TPA: AraC family transcriptional regulator [Chitinophaga sp.]|uniref:helix-turn-helix transcriptional regulator n=1 Tax=Chitinophaga sp. TaxID=1869181 RepID=UPI002BB4676F|nr:AraC family transcriptional regulator [Chitinophaga sp.]HVI47342.1 AraC family transcriptional regulator [Chitinophaga sp.]